MTREKRNKSDTPGASRAGGARQPAPNLIGRSLHRSVVESSPDPMIILDGQGHIQYVNPAGLELLRLDLAKVKGERMQALFPYNMAKSLAIGIRQTLAEGCEFNLEGAIESSSSWRWYQYTFAPMPFREGETPLILCIARDITAHWQIEEALRESEERYRLMFDHVPVGLYRTTLDGKILDANPALVQMLGYPDRAALLTVRAADLYVDPADRLHEMALLEREGIARDYEMRLRRCDGSAVWVRDTCRAVYNMGQDVLCYEGSLEDITRRKQAEETLKQTNMRLALSVSELQQHDQEMMLLNRLHDLLQTCMTPEEAYRVTELSARELFANLSGCLAIARADAPVLDTVACWGDPSLAEAQFASDACWALRQGQLHDVRNPAIGLMCQHFTRPPQAATVCLPLMVQGQVLGLLSIMASESRAAVPIQLAVSTAEAVKLSLSNLRLRAALREQAIRDPLTGLFNRRYLQEVLPGQLHRTSQSRIPLSVAMIDIDHFKQFNDTFGHDAGDTLLCELSRLFQIGLRKTDVACRYGGEEFVLVLPGATASEVYARLNHLRENAREMRVRHAGQLLGAVTLSIGVVQAAPDVAADEVVRQADEAMYSAKRAGRNCVVSQQSGAQPPGAQSPVG